MHTPNNENWLPEVLIDEDETHVFVQIIGPADPRMMKTAVGRDHVVIRGLIKEGKNTVHGFQKTFSLPDHVDPNTTQANFKNHTLTISIKKLSHLVEAHDVNAPTEIVLTPRVKRALRELRVEEAESARRNDYTDNRDSELPGASRNN